MSQHNFKHAFYDDSFHDVNVKKKMSIDADEGPVTTKRELWGWYLYEASSSGWSGSVLPIFLPLLLLNIATEQAWLNRGSTMPKSCTDELVDYCIKCVPGHGDKLQTAQGLVDIPRLRVYISSIGINPISYATVAIGISVIVQIFVFITCGPLVDYGNARKKVMNYTTVVGALGSMACFTLYKPHLWWVGAILLMIANSSYGLGYIAYNSYLAILTDNTPEMIAAKTIVEEDLSLLRSIVENRISLVGITVGSVSGAACLLISFLVSFVPNVSDELILRAACVIGGLWWLIGYIPTLAWLQQCPGPPFPAGAGPLLGWTNILDLIKDSKKYKYAFRFLILFFIYSDGYTTVNQVVIFFAQEELCMTTTELAAVAFLVSIFALVGNPIFGLVQRRFKLDNKWMLVINIALMSLVPLYGILGFFTPPGSFGWKHKEEVYVLAGWYGATLGACFSYSRTLFLDLIPAGKEAAMFSLWSLSSRGSAWIGPIMVAIIVQFTDNLRSTFIYVVVVMAVPSVLLVFFVNNKLGLEASGRMRAHLDRHPGSC